MKPSIFIISFLLLVTSLFGQTPEGINYQAVARDGDGNILSNASINIKFTVRESEAAGTIVYQEVASSSTNDFGLFSVIIGDGIPLTGIFNEIAWGSNSHFLQVEVDPGGGFIDMGATQLVSVPYALYAKEAEFSINDSDNQTLSLDDSVLSISNGNSVILPTGSGSGGPTYTPGTGISIKNGSINALSDSGLWNASQLRGRNIAAMAPELGQVLKWDGTGWVPAPDDTASIGSYWTRNQFNDLYYDGNVFVGIGNISRALGVHGVFQLSADQGEFFQMRLINGDLRFNQDGSFPTRPALTLGDTGHVGIGTAFPVANFEVVAEDVNPGELVSLEVKDTLRVNSDVLNMEVPAGTRNAEFIEMRRGGVIQAAIHTDGSAEFRKLEMDTLSAQHLKVISDFVAPGELVTFEVNQTLNPNSDVLNLQVPLGAKDAQFIEMTRGNTVQAAINTDGSAQFSRVKVDEVLDDTKPAPRGGIYANTIPLAYGAVNANGTLKNNSYGVKSISKFRDGDYRIELDNSLAGGAMIIANIDHYYSGGSPHGNIKIINTYKVSGSVIGIQILEIRQSINPNSQKILGDAVDEDFNFIVYGRP